MLAAIIAGQTYQVTTTGVVDLASGYNGGLGLPFTADGKPTYAFPAPYAPFYPNGLDYDPSQSPAAVGPGGAGKLLGSLIGTFATSPGPSDYFTLGLSYTFVAPFSGNLYGLVNDCVGCYPGNAGSFNVTVAAVAVPEPKAWFMMIAGFALAGAGIRSRRVAMRPALI